MSLQSGRTGPLYLLPLRTPAPAHREGMRCQGAGGHRAPAQEAPFHDKVRASVLPAYSSSGDEPGAFHGWRLVLGCICTRIHACTHMHTRMCTLSTVAGRRT